jgi:hypothetical protein
VRADANASDRQVHDRENIVTWEAAEVPKDAEADRPAMKAHDDTETRTQKQNGT